MRATVEGLRTKQTGTSRYVGISRRKDTGKWRAQFGHDVYRVNLGTFDTEAEAVQAMADYCRRKGAK